jgi:D-alanyl-D-alanine carboxypeptidase/D-alanyl-D-alanine-endopeptidase (penicillin-binding protein 4)
VGAEPMRMTRQKGAIAIVLLAAALAAAPSAHARPQGPDRAFRTPVAYGAASAHTAVSRSKLAAGLGRLFRKAGKSGAFVLDPSSHRVLFSRKGGRARILASNSKIFTTSTALSRFLPDTRLHTTAWSTDDITDGVSQGLYLRGGGDPTLSATGLTKLADRVRAAGVVTVQGPLRYDDSFLDHVTGIPESGISPEGIGTLSGLEVDNGSSSDPARSAAQRFEDALRKDGISIGTSVTPAEVPQSASQIADFASETMADLVRDTNVPSNNFYAEMLLKDMGSQFGSSGSTAAGLDVVRRFASQQGASFNGENGSGLTRRNKASPASVVKLLDSMIEIDKKKSPEEQLAQERLRDAWISSLAVAGRTGTVAHRMRGTAAAGNCHLKTGTLDRVSALSGYCFRGGDDADHAVIFSLLMNNTDVNHAHTVQDRMAALIARYSR